MVQFLYTLTYYKLNIFHTEFTFSRITAFSANKYAKTTTALNRMQKTLLKNAIVANSGCNGKYTNNDQTLNNYSRYDPLSNQISVNKILTPGPKRSVTLCT